MPAADPRPTDDFRMRGDFFAVLRVPRSARIAAACARATAAIAVLAIAPVVLPAPAAAQVPEPAAPVTIDGPSADIVGLSGISVARDGTGGIVYVKQALGTAHVFVSRLDAGVFQPPQQIDTGLVGDSSQPVIAAGNGGLLLVAFINRGQLYVVTRPAAAAAYAGPVALADGAGDPALAMNNFGKAYLAFSDTGAGGHDVRIAYFVSGNWSVVPTPLDADPSDDAGSGSARPAVAAATDGVGIVAWGEGAHVYTRRVWGTAPSAAFERADVPSFQGGTEVSADKPALAVGGDSSFVSVAFHELLVRGTAQQSRVLSRLLQGPAFDGASAADGITGAEGGGAQQPRVVMGEFGRGLVTSVRDGSEQLFAQLLGTRGFALGTIRLDSLQNTAAPQAVPAMAGQRADLVAWQQNPDSGAAPEIRVRYSSDGTAFGGELVISSPFGGPANAALGLVAGGDFSGNAAVAWVQGNGDSARIVSDQLYQPPSSFAATVKFRYVRSTRPLLSWSQARDHWGPVRYTVTIDQGQVYQTSGTSLLVPGALVNGPHTWLVTASNPAGVAVSTRAARVWVDTVPPAVQASLTGVRRVGRPMHALVTTSDSPPPVLPASASGIARVTINWGEGGTVRIVHGSSHVYLRPGHYKLTIVAVDRAGNRTTSVRELTIKPKPKPKKKRKQPKKPRPPTRHHAARSR